MINYNDPSRWVILQYRPGTGGKFLCAALMTIDRVAHWDSRVEHQEISYQDWVNEQWQHQQDNKWIAYEPLHSWNTRFFSRTFPRGEDVDIEDYNKLMLLSSDYFKEVWASGKLVLDFINKSTIPNWWKDSMILRLDAKSNCPIHRRLLLSKIYPYNADTMKGMVMMDHPLPDNPSPNARIYKNQYEFGPFIDQDAWYKYIWENDFRLNFKIPSPDILLPELLDFKKLKQYIRQISQTLNSTYDQNDLRYVWEVWMNKHEKILKSIDL